MKNNYNSVVFLLLFSLAALFVTLMFDSTQNLNRIFVFILALGILGSLNTLLTRKKLQPVKIN